MNRIKCPFCSCDAYTPGSNFDADGGKVICIVCGDFYITQDAWDDYFLEGSITVRQKANISAWLQGKAKTKLDSEDIEQLLELRPPSVIARLDNLLFELSQEPDNLGWIGISNKFRPTVWAQDGEELGAFFGRLEEAGWVKCDALMSCATIVTEGWRQIEKLSMDRGSGIQCFVAMSFAEELTEIFTKAISPAIKRAGYSDFRVDMSEHNRKIDDEIVAQIRRSRFMVADFTEQRGGVYYEAGLAQGLGLPVIWTCRKDDINNLHFDIRQYNCLTWNTNDLLGFETALQYRIESIIGRGPLNPQ